jgi:putative glycosyltransferase (TIGR04372 family)
MNRLIRLFVDILIERSTLLNYLLMRLSAQNGSGGLSLIEFCFFRSWQYAERLFVRGRYPESIALRSQTLRKIYLRWGAENISHYPEFYSSEFWDAFGHRAILGIHIAAQRNGLLDRGQRILHINENDLGNPLVKIYGEEIKFEVRNFAKPIGRLPREWVNFEQISTIKSTDGFVDIYQLIDKLFTHKSISKSNPLFTLPYDYTRKAAVALESLGLPADAWFVTLHVRDDGQGPSRRNQRIEDYEDSIDEIIQRGGWVVRIGDASMRQISERKNFIDLTKFGRDFFWLHPFTLSQCRFFIGTQSGPASFPPLFGVPCINTNATSIGRNVFRSSKNSFYIPKLLRNRDGSYLTLRQTLSTPEGFGEPKGNGIRTGSLYFVDNSSEDILEATREMFERLTGSDLPSVFYHHRVSEIRRDFPMATSGEFGVSFMKRNAWWMS